jgi:arylformamidase
MRYELSDYEWAVIKSMLPNKPCGVRRVNDRRVLNGILVGDDELPELRRQSATYADAAGERGLPVALTVLPGRHHYSILDELSRPDGAITRALVELIGAGDGRNPR